MTSRARQLAGAGLGVLLLLVAAGAVAAVVLQPPTVAVVDEGDWGSVTDRRTEVVTTLRIENPNPIGVTLDRGLHATYRLSLNGVTVATGNRSRLRLPPGNRTATLTTHLRNEKLIPWWAAYVRSNETITLEVTGAAHVDAPLVGGSYPISAVERTIQANETPVIAALSGAVERLEGDYSRSVSITAGGVTRSATVGYEVRDAWATWGPANRTRSVVRFHVVLHNPGTVPMPAAPDGVAARLRMNDVPLLRTEGTAFSLKSVDEDAVIRPGETRELVIQVAMDNRRIDEWFVSHVRRGERTRLDVAFYLAFDVDGAGTIRVPNRDAATYSCTLETGILVDNRSTTTTCGDAPGASART